MIIGLHNIDLHLLIINWLIVAEKKHSWASIEILFIMAEIEAENPWFKISSISSMIKCLINTVYNIFFYISYSTLPGVPITIWQVVSNSFIFKYIGDPPIANTVLIFK